MVVYSVHRDDIQWLYCRRHDYQFMDADLFCYHCADEWEKIDAPTDEAAPDARP